ncbi:unnamed protein product [Echinostoma caproni]|uniref:Uncharacterized protein n=1 Tax=Echinostoma caproni TaxID=27848 RepID=A0A183B949_9TREM|nr:unnamed protein product [Echinostoma caproni]
MMGSRQELPPLPVNTSHSKAIDTPTVTRRNPCGASSSCTETVERAQLPEAALRCRSQPSEPPLGSTSPIRTTVPPDERDNMLIPKTTPPTVVMSGTIDSGSTHMPTAVAMPVTTVGLKRRRGPSLDTFDSLNVTGSDALTSNHTLWCLSPVENSNQKHASNPSPHPNDATLVRNGRTSSVHPETGSVFSPFGSWSSSVPGISPFRVPCSSDGGGGSTAGDVFIFGSGSRFETDPDPDEGTIKRESDPGLSRFHCHTCPVCTYGRAIAQTTVGAMDEGMWTEQTGCGMLDGETACSRSPVLWKTMDLGSHATGNVETAIQRGVPCPTR